MVRPLFSRLLILSGYQRRFVGTLLVALCLSVSLLPSKSASAIDAPGAFTARPLNTYQTNGIAWALASARGLVFVGGSFTAVRPAGSAAGQNELVRNNIAVFDAATGAPTDCTPAVTTPSNPNYTTVRALAVSPDGATLYIGGSFSQVNGATHRNLAAVDIASCRVINSFAPSVSGRVRAITANDSTVYFAGMVSSVNDLSRTYAAAVASNTSQLLPWTPRFDGEVTSLALRPDGQAIVIGGSFNTVNDGDSHALAIVDPINGATVKAFPGQFIPVNSVVKDIAVDAKGFYTANEGFGYHVFDGRLALNWSDYGLRWRDNCYGATQAVVAYRNILYSGSHAHDCSEIGGYPDGARHHLLAEPTTKAALLPWFPDTNGGQGESLGPRDMAVATAADGQAYLWVAGEFTEIDGQPQQGLTRFGTTGTTAPPSVPQLQVSSDQVGSLRVTWQRSADADDVNLTYRLYRDGAATPLRTISARSWFWSLQQLTYTDDGLSVGSKHRYAVTVSDGNTTVSSVSKSALVASATSPYLSSVLASKPTFLWRYNENKGSYAADAATPTHSGSLTDGINRTGERGGAIDLTGNGSLVYSDTMYPSPQEYSLETWFKTALPGGKLIGFSNTQLVRGPNYDRHIYLTDSGQLVFGVYSAGFVTLTSPNVYTDNTWHQVVATQGSSGMALYVDGQPVANNSVSTGTAYSGYWQVGAGNVGNWPGAPTRPYFRGQIDDTAVYPSVLSAETINQHYGLGT